MPWECVGCANVYDVPTKPRICPECGSRQVISDEPDEVKEQRDRRFDRLMGFALGPRPED